MTKQALQQELKAKVKEGVKPSDLKKLKRSKSADDVSSESLSPPNLVRSKSAQELEPAPTLEALETRISVLELTVETKDRELVEKTGTIAIYSDQLKNKQGEVELLRKDLENKNQELKSLKAEHSTLLDSNLELKHQSLKDWWTQYQQTKSLESELKENIDYASEELLTQDQTISTLRLQNSKLKQTNQSLQKDLALTSKLAQLRKTPLPNTLPNSSWTTYALTFCLIGIVLYSLLK